MQAADAAHLKVELDAYIPVCYAACGNMLYLVFTQREGFDGVIAPCNRLVK